MLSGAMAQSSDNTGICYLLPVLWMTSCFPIMGPMACTIGNIYEEHRAGASSHKFLTYSAGGAKLFDFVVIYSGSKLRSGGVDNDDMRGTAIGWLPAAGTIKARDEVCFL